MANRRCLQKLLSLHLPSTYHCQNPFLYPVHTITHAQFHHLPPQNLAESTISTPPKCPSSFFRSFCCNARISDHEEEEEDDDDDDDDGVSNADENDEESGNVRGKSDKEKAKEAKSILNRILMLGSETQAIIGGPVLPDAVVCAVVEEQVTVSSELVAEVLSRLQNNWEAAFTFFLWAGKQQGYQHSLREYHCMVSILGKMRKFDTAWGLIEEMRVKSLVTPHTLMILIRRYCAAHDVANAISTFYALKRYGFEASVEEFHDLLSALCRYKNVKDAEHLLFCNKAVYPLSTKSFNIVLNGWCNVVGDLREAQRVWREMKNRGFFWDAYSYSSMLSCYSKFGRLQSLLKLFDQMKRFSITPDCKVYNAVIHALAKAKYLKEARNLMKTMEENGIHPSSVTYNSVIMPVCRSRQLDVAREIFDEMIERGMSPTVRTFHGFFRIVRSDEEVFELLQKMKMTSCKPNHDTYIMLIRKFCRWRQFENVFKLWNEMSSVGLDHDRSSYIVLIHGLFLNGKLEESYQYYLEMKKKHLLPEPKIEEMLHTWLAGKQTKGMIMESKVPRGPLENKDKIQSKKHYRKADVFRHPEARKVVRERGFSFWSE